MSDASDVRGSGPLVFPLRRASVRRVQLLQALGEHGPIALALLGAGVATLRSGAGGGARLLAVAELAAALWQIVTFAREMRETVHIERARRAVARGAVAVEPVAVPHLKGIVWPDLVAGVLLAVDAWHRYDQTGRLVRPQLVLATFMVLVAFVRGRFVGPLRLVVSADGLDYRPRPWRRVVMAWTDIASLELSATELRATSHDGRALHVPAARFDGGAAMLAEVRRALPRLAPALASRLADAGVLSSP
jgi:hypothetical protein